MAPKISVIIPHLSRVGSIDLSEREDGLRRCIESIDRQVGFLHSDIEKIVLDGPGTVPEKVAAGLKESSGDYIVFAANDVEFSMDSFRLAVKDSIESNKALVAFDGGSVLPDEGNICEHFLIRKDFVPSLEGGQIFSTDFHHVGCDNWLWAQAKRLGQAMRSTRAKITHHHFSKNRAAMDAVYELGWSKVEEDRKTLGGKMEKLKNNRIYSNNWFELRIGNFEHFISRFSGRPVRCLEIGSFEGRSANWIVENWCTYPGSYLTCVDPFTGSVEHSSEEKEGLFERFQRNTADNSTKIRVIRMESHTALQRLIAAGGKFDFIYIDGDHHRDAVAKDAELAHQLLVPGGLLAFDDYTWGGGLESWQRPQEAIDDFLSTMGDEYEVAIKNAQVFAWKKDSQTNEKKRPKIAVYAISKNESKFVERFCRSCKDADLIVITDTGSTDGTVEAARSLGAVAHSVSISPWRFDIARNASIALIPPDIDICVNLDLDEVLEPGWREEIEAVWEPGTTRLRYLFDWGSGVRFMSNKIHSRKGYMWKHPCHELLVPDPRTTEVYAHTEKLLVRHLPDPTKSRGQYIDLLEIGVKEDPYCPRNSFYYARELTFYNRHQDALKELKRYLDLPTATWADERAFAMRLLGSTHHALGNKELALDWYTRGTAEAPHRRESWFALAEHCYKVGVWDTCYDAATRCISTPNSNQWPTDSRAGSAAPHDIAAIAAYRLGKKEESVKHGRDALELSPDDERLKANMRWYLGEM